MEEKSSDFDYYSMCRIWIAMLLVLCTVALLSNRPKGVSLYDASVDERAVPAIEGTLRGESVKFYTHEGRLVVPHEDVAQARVILFRKGLPGFPPVPEEMGPRSGPEWFEQETQAEATVEPFLRSIPGVQDYRISYGCPGCHYYWPDDHTCDRVWLRILTNSSFDLTAEERLGLLSFLAHSMSGVDTVGFVVIDESNGQKPYSYSLDLRLTTGRIKVEDCEFTTY